MNRTKIILNIRSYKDFTKSNYDKWSRNLAYTKTFDNNKLKFLSIIPTK